MKKKIAVEIKYQSKGTFPDRLIIGITGKLSAKQPIIGCWPYKTKKHASDSTKKSLMLLNVSLK